MQDRYAGDVGDFMKFGLLRSLVQGPVPLRLGVNWYLTGDESHNADGKHIGYLDPTSTHHASLRTCDPDLMERLAGVVRTDRSVAALQAASVLPAGTVTYAERLDDSMGSRGRREWHEQALFELKGLDVVFVDPDNGIRNGTGGSKPSKFVFGDELADYAARDQSMVVYHHADRSAGGVDAQVPRRLHQLGNLTGVEPLGAVVARRGSTRYFFVIPSINDRELLYQALGVYLDRWTPHAEFIPYSVEA